MLEELKVQLFRRKITQAEPARTVGVSDTHLSRIVRGQARCRARLRRRIAEYPGVRESEVFPPGARKRKSNNPRPAQESTKGGTS